MAETDLHCNIIKCRKPLGVETQACVTSCSHVFCVDCANQIFSKVLACPACNTNLPESDDIILTQLNPSEEYKSSVLSGLKPDVVLDICSRAIAFYEYQTSQELCFRSILQKNSEDKYHSLKNHYNATTRELGQLVKSEKERQIVLLKEHDLERKKSQQLYSKYEEKSKQFQKLQVMYEKLKRKTIAPNIQESFNNNNNHPLIASATAAGPPNNYPGVDHNNSDVVSRFVRPTPTLVSSMTSVAAAAGHHTHPMARPPMFYPQQQRAPPPSAPIYNNSNRPSGTRIPSPVHSVYSVRSQRKYNNYSNTIIGQ